MTGRRRALITRLFWRQESSLRAADMANPDYRYTIKTDGERRVFLSISERASGDVTVILKHADYHMGVASNPDELIRTQRYSLHVSPKSLDYSTVKHTIELDNGRRLTSAHVTSVVKGDVGRFAILFQRLVPDLRNDKYRIGIHDKAKICNLGEYDPANFTFSHALIIGSPSHEFPTLGGDFNITQRVFGKFRLVVLWSFLTLPSAPIGRLVHNLTVPPELAGNTELEQQMKNLMDGVDARECINLYSVHRMVLTQNWLSAVGSGLPDKDRKQLNTMAATATYVRVPSLSTSEMQAHIKKVLSQLDTSQ
jgi:hypothetical protein